MIDILSGWGQIANHLKVSEKTALRYGKERGLPISYDPAGHPVITKAKADQWRLKSQLSS